MHFEQSLQSSVELLFCITRMKKSIFFDLYKPEMQKNGLLVHYNNNKQHVVGRKFIIERTNNRGFTRDSYLELISNLS